VHEEAALLCHLAYTLQSNSQLTQHLGLHVSKAEQVLPVAGLRVDIVCNEFPDNCLDVVVVPLELKRLHQMTCRDSKFSFILVVMGQLVEFDAIVGLVNLVLYGGYQIEVLRKVDYNGLCKGAVVEVPVICRVLRSLSIIVVDLVWEVQPHQLRKRVDAVPIQIAVSDLLRQVSSQRHGFVVSRTLGGKRQLCLMSNGH